MTESGIPSPPPEARCLSAEQPSLGPTSPGAASRGFGRNTLINVSGLVVPLTIGLVTVPLYLRRIGQERYGVLAIVWVVLGYFAVFEFGLGRATANRIAQVSQDPRKREQVFWSALAINLGIGVFGAFVLFGVGHALLSGLLKAPSDLRAEAVAALPWLCAAVPLTTASAVLAGAFEGCERFLTLNLVTLLGTAMYQLAPLAYAYRVGPNLTGLIMTSTLALLASTVISLLTAAAMLPLRHVPRVEPREFSRLFRYGGWVAVGGLTGSFFMVADRVLIGIVSGARSVTQYTIPSTLVSRTLLLATGFARTIFPRLSGLGQVEARRVTDDALRGLLAFMTPLVVLGLVIVEPFLRIWAGAGIAKNGASVAEILLLGVWLNGLAVVPYAFLQSQGRPDLTAKISVIELAPYLGALWFGLHFLGLNGAAWAWTARAGVDAGLLLWVAWRVHPGPSLRSQQSVVFGSGAFVVVACCAALIFFEHAEPRIVVGLALLGGALVWSWRLVPRDLLHLRRNVRE